MRGQEEVGDRMQACSKCVGGVLEQESKAWVLQLHLGCPPHQGPCFESWSSASGAIGRYRNMQGMQLVYQLLLCCWDESRTRNGFWKKGFIFA